MQAMGIKLLVPARRQRIAIAGHAAQPTLETVSHVSFLLAISHLDFWDRRRRTLQTGNYIDHPSTGSHQTKHVALLLFCAQWA